MKVCLVKTSSMGDILHSLPALTDAQQHIPDLQVDWVVEESFAEIPRWHSVVQNVIPIALRRWRKTPLAKDTRQQWQSYRTLLQQANYDAVIDAQGLFKSAFFATRLAKGKKYGYDRHSIREPIASFFYDEKASISYQQHAVERIRQLFAHSLNYQQPTSPADYSIAQHFILNSSQKPYVFFLHGTTREDKFLPPVIWRKLAEKLTALDIEVRLAWVNMEEKQRAEWICQDLEQAIVLPKSNLYTIAQQLANACAVISVDTGLAHLTAALDKPNLTLYGATDPKLIGTYGKNQQHLTAPSMQAMSAEQILDNFLVLLHKK